MRPEIGRLKPESRYRKDETLDLAWTAEIQNRQCAPADHRRLHAVWAKQFSSLLQNVFIPQLSTLRLSHSAIRPQVSAPSFQVSNLSPQVFSFSPSGFLFPPFIPQASALSLPLTVFRHRHEDRDQLIGFLPNWIGLLVRNPAVVAQQFQPKL